MEAIKVEKLSFSYTPEHQVLKEISFEVEKGQFVSLLGPNGAGKSTLFSCMLSLRKNYTGTVTAEGTDIRKLSPRELASKIAYVPQSAEHAFSYSVENVVLMGTTSQSGVFASPRKREERLAYEAMERLNIEYLRGKSFRNISGGEKQLVLIARALAQQAKILFMDEPTSSLDYGNQCRVLDEMKKLSAEGYTVIESTHSPQQALMYSDNVIALYDGCIAAKGRTEEIVDSALLSKLYGINVRVEALPGENIKLCIPENNH